MKKILITGASGYIGSQLVKKLIQLDGEPLEIIGTDILPRYFSKAKNPFTFKAADLTTDEVAQLIEVHQPDVVIHLAAIVAANKNMTREFIYDVEVNGTKRILNACIKHNVAKIITTSSGAAYGYHKDNPAWLKEADSLRGNEEFPYAWHKRMVEEIMAEYRQSQPALKQVIFRVSTILGKRTKNDITNLFQKKKVMGLRGTDTPFVIIWDEDLVNCLAKAAIEDIDGIYNVAGDGIITLREMAGLIKKPFTAIPPGLIKAALTIAKPLKISRYGPEQVKFLQYRPVLDNQKLKEEFSYIPRKTSREVFLYYAHENGLIES